MLVAAGGTALLASCGAEEKGAQGGEGTAAESGSAAGNQRESGGPNVGVTLSDITENPEEFVGAR